MTDYDIRKKNALTGVAIRMRVKNAEKFKPEIQQAFRDLIHAVEYPKQKKMTDYDKDRYRKIPFDIIIEEYAEGKE